VSSARAIVSVEFARYQRDPSLRPRQRRQEPPGMNLDPAPDLDRRHRPASGSGRRATCESGLPWTRLSRRVAATAICAGVILGSTLAAHAQGGKAGLPIIRDAEIEELLRDYLRPILKVAGLAQQNIEVVLVNSRTFNAFVMDGRRIFVNTGALLDSRTPNQIIGVLAHEAGHIAGGHLSRLRGELADAQNMAMIGMLMAGGAMAAGAATGSQGGVQAGAALLSMQGEIVKRSILSYQRSQEEAADRAAVRFLNATGQSSKGLYDTFARFAEQTMFLSQSVDPYLQSHPMARERLKALAELGRSSPHWNKTDSPELQLRHDLMRAKIVGFTERPDAIARRYPASDSSLPARYARAISAYRFTDIRNATREIDSLIQAMPNSPYLHELKGQALLESGRAREAIAPLRRAVAMAPGAHLIRIMLGQAMVATNDPALLDEAIGILQRGLAHEREASDGFRYLAMAYGRKKDYGQADLASAQAAFAAGDIKTARELAGRARQRFPTGSPGWIRADDIYSYRPPARLSGASRN
jgi:predicted Zn-dependent protease